MRIRVPATRVKAYLQRVTRGSPYVFRQDSAPAHIASLEGRSGGWPHCANGWTEMWWSWSCFTIIFSTILFQYVAFWMYYPIFPDYAAPPCMYRVRDGGWEAPLHWHMGIWLAVALAYRAGVGGGTTLARRWCRTPTKERLRHHHSSGRQSRSYRSEPLARMKAATTHDGALRRAFRNGSG